MSKIVITGASGFIGLELLKILVKKKNTIYLILKNSKKNYLLKKKLKNKKIKFVFFKFYSHLKKKTRNIYPSAIIHLATYYKNNHTFEDIEKFNRANILFGNIILEIFFKKKIKKFINVCSAMQNSMGLKKNPENLYASSKEAFNAIVNFYKKKNKSKFYNLYLEDTYSENDKRNKILPTIKRNYIKNKKTTLIAKKLTMNFTHVSDVINAIFILLTKKIDQGNYQVFSKKEENIYKLIENFNKNKTYKNKIKIKILEKKFKNKKYYRFKKVPFWKETFFFKNQFNEIFNDNKKK
jgi:nucleoside-diphosphate-sugar epimerase